MSKEEMQDINDITYRRYQWSIPSIYLFLKSACLDEVQGTIESVFKLKLNFTKKNEDQLNLYVLPLIPLSGFSFTLSWWLGGGGYARVSLSEATFECVPPITWILCHTMSVKQITGCLNSSFTTSDIKENVRITFEIKFDKIRNSAIESSISLLNDLEQLLVSGRFHDALIKTTEGTELKVHKIILASRCEVFNAAFQHDLIESATNMIETQFDDETMKNLLLYLYCDKTPKIKTILVKMLVAANYYQLNALKYKCEEILVVEHLSGDNALEFLELALTHSYKILEKGVLNFINKNNISDIVQSENWQSANNEVLKKICEHCVILLNK